VPSRISAYTAVDVALSTITSKILPNSEVEMVSVEDSLGRTTAREVLAPFDVPKLPSSHMDGFAVISKDVENATASHPRTLKVVGAATPGAREKRVIGKGEAMQVATGAMLPPGADTVIPKENVEVIGDKVVLTLAPEKGSYVYKAGEDFHKGDLALGKGRRIRAQDIGLMIGLGLTKLEVWARPRITVIATGSELTRSSTPEAGKIRESHSPVFLSLLRSMGCIPVDGGVVGDDPKALAEALQKALAGTDFVITLGGTSAGGKDLIVDVVAGLSPAALVHGIKLDRGRVTGIACVKGKPVLMLPGPIQAAMNAFLVLGVPLAKVLSGREEHDTSFACRLGKDWEGRRRFSDFRKVVYVKLRSGAETIADPLLGETESIRILTDADAYFIVPESVTRIRAGTVVNVSLVPGFSVPQ